MPLTMHQLKRRYPSLTIDQDPTARDAAGKEIAKSILAQLNELERARPMVSESLEIRKTLRRDLLRYRVSFVSGRRGSAGGIVVGCGDTQAAALADAARRLGKQ